MEVYAIRSWLHHVSELYHPALEWLLRKLEFTPTKWHFPSAKVEGYSVQMELGYWHEGGPAGLGSKLRLLPLRVLGKGPRDGHKAQRQAALLEKRRPWRSFMVCGQWLISNKVLWMICTVTGIVLFIQHSVTKMHPSRCCAEKTVRINTDSSESSEGYRPAGRKLWKHVALR